ncbi:MAG TPA: menaquinone biosynthesis protein [Candidatus Acidoferrales bacterium]|nr:menaquinone biosynthesis protein [Candidatus Acidoferrales bacterium]
MARLRISIVEFLNTAPLVWGFTDGPLAGRYDLSFTVPSKCADALRQGAADIAIIPAIEYQRIENLAILPGMSVAAKSEVRSILLIAKKPIERARRIALDTSSRSSVALVQLLCRNFWGISPQFVRAEPDPAAMLAEADAALIIGDPALRIAIKAEELRTKEPSEEFCCGGDPNAQIVPGVDSLFVYDIAHQWREMTARPAVLAVWAARRDVVNPKLVADFEASKAFGMSRIRDIAEGASLKLDLPAAELERYLRENIDFSLDDDNLAGLKLYFEQCAEAGLIFVAKPLEFAESGHALPRTA